MTQEIIGQLTRAAGAGLTAFGTACLLTPIVRHVAVRAGFVANPVSDRWGKRVTARLGGIAMFAGVLLSAVIWIAYEPMLGWLLAGLLMAFVLGLMDDVRRLAPYTKLVGQILIGCVVVMGGIRIELIQWPWLAVPLSVLWFVLIMNAFNLLDNMDGLAVGVGAIAAAFCGFHAILAGQWFVVIFAAILVGVCLGFLCFNMPPAKIYMGDSGSHLIGLSLAALALLGTWRHSTQLLSVLAVPVLVLAVPIFDTLFVTIQRLVHRQHPFVGGTDHLSHRLAILGLTERQTVMALYGLSIGLGLLSIVSIFLKTSTAVVLWIFTFVALVVLGRYLAHVKVYRLEAVKPDESRTRRRSVTLIETMLMHKRRLVEVLVDFALVTGSYVGAHLLRYEGTLAPDIQALVIQSLPIVLLIKLTCFVGSGLYRGVWRYVGLSDALSVFRATGLGSILSALALLYLWRFEGYSRAVFIIDWMLTLLTVGGARVGERLLDQWVHHVQTQDVPTLIVGAGDTGSRVLRSIKYDARSSLMVVGFIDDDSSKRGSRIYGVPVRGSSRQMPEILKQHQVRRVLIAITDPPGHLLQHVRECCEPLGVSWKVVLVGVTEVV